MPNMGKLPIVAFQVLASCSQIIEKNEGDIIFSISEPKSKFIFIEEGELVSLMILKFAKNVRKINETKVMKFQIGELLGIEGLKGYSIDEKRGWKANREAPVPRARLEVRVSSKRAVILEVNLDKLAENCPILLVANESHRSIVSAVTVG